MAKQFMAGKPTLSGAGYWLFPYSKERVNWVNQLGWYRGRPQLSSRRRLWLIIL